MGSCEDDTFQGHLLVTKGGFATMQKILAAGFGPLAPPMPDNAWSRWVPVPSTASSSSTNAGPALGRLELVGAGHEWCNQVFSEGISHHARRAGVTNNWPGDGSKVARLRCTTTEPTEVWLAGCDLDDCETTNALQSLNDYFGLATPTSATWDLCIANNTTTTTNTATTTDVTTTLKTTPPPPPPPPLDESTIISGGALCPRADIILDYTAAPAESKEASSSTAPASSFWQTAHAIFGPHDVSPSELLGADDDDAYGALVNMEMSGSNSNSNSGQLAPTLALPIDGCSPIAAVSKGSLVVMARGSCPFALKSKHAAAAGAAVAII